MDHNRFVWHVSEWFHLESCFYSVDCKEIDELNLSNNSLRVILLMSRNKLIAESLDVVVYRFEWRHIIVHYKKRLKDEEIQESFVRTAV